MGKITLKLRRDNLQCCPLCGHLESTSPDVRLREDWIRCGKCGTVYRRVWRAGGGGNYEDICT